MVRCDTRILARLMLRFHSMITYPNYKFYFPIKALGKYMKIFGDERML